MTGRILAAGLSPAWQQIVVLDSLKLGEVNRAAEVHWCASGKVLNVGLALHRLGAKSRTLSVLGGPAAAFIEREFAAESIPRRWIETEAPTRVCTTVIDRAAGQITELVENARGIQEKELAAFRAAYREEAAIAAVVVVTGSLPAGVPETLFAELLAVTPGRSILDIRGRSLTAALPARPFLVKPNREELSQTVGRPLASDHDLRDAAREILNAGAQWILVTQGSGPAWLCGDGETWTASPPPVAVVNPIASGDCLSAALALGLSLGLTVPEALRLGLAAAAENVCTLLPAQLNEPSVRHLASRIEVRSLRDG